MGPNAMILVFFMLCFKPAFLLSSFNLIKTLFSSFSLYDMRVVSSTYLKLFIFLPAILIPACESSSLEFFMMYSWRKIKSLQWKKHHCVSETWADKLNINKKVMNKSESVRVLSDVYYQGKEQL